MPLVKALLAQILATAAVFLLVRAGLLAAPPGVLVLAQGALAAFVALGLRSERWWLPIHLAFAPAVLAALHLDLPPALYLAAFALCALVFWSSYRTRVPLYLSNRDTVAALARLLAGRAPGRLLDIGSGTGSLVVPLARQLGAWQVTGIESAPLPYLLARWRARACPNLDIRRGDFFAADWQGYDVVYAFLSPVPMSAVWRKACAELRAGSLVVSNSFAVEEASPEAVIEVGDRAGTRLLCYRPSSRKVRKGR